MDSFAMMAEGSSPHSGSTPLRRSGQLARDAYSPYAQPSSPISQTRSHHPHPQPYPHPHARADQSYAFPPAPPTQAASTSHSPHSPKTSIPHRVSLSARSRRTSPLLHEIQPPNRRLSSHQMLLLTPFGAVLPAGALPTGPAAGPTAYGGSSAGMARGSSTMGRAPASRSSGSASMLPSPSSMGGPPPAASSGAMSRQYTRRHNSLVNPLVGPSPLASAPMTTIPSASDNSSSSSGGGSVPPSRDPSHERIDKVPSLVGGFPGTVPMSRSSSLPVMTLRELQALKEKDGELGIARGGGWAWVSHQEEQGEDEDAQFAEDSITPASTARPSFSTSASSNTPPSARSVFPFTAFNDPFASASSTPASGSSMQRDGPVFAEHYQPAATMPGYHYSPTYNDTRRMSEAPIDSSPVLGPGLPRRPSAPSPSMPSAQTSPTFPTPTPRSAPFNESAALGPSPRHPRGGTQTVGRASGRASGGASPSGPGVQRPRITRYKSLPGRNEGLGLEIHVRKGTSASTASGSDRRESEGSASTGSQRRSSRGRTSGSWAAVDIVDSLAATDLGSRSSPSRSPLSSGRPSIHTARSVRSAHSAHSVSPTTGGPSSTDNFLMVEEITTRAHLAEFGAPTFGAGQGDKGKGRARYDSFDSAAFPGVGSKSGGYVAQLAQSGWNATFPRRGSLAVLTRTALGPWAVGNGLAGLGLGDKDRVVSGAAGGPGAPGGHWSDRRGSWAEGWSKS